MPLALLRAHPARGLACLEHRAEHRHVPLRLAAHDAARGSADIGTVKAQPAAPEHLRHVRFGNIGIRADRAGGRALGAGLDAAGGGLEVADGPGMGSQQLLNGHCLSSRPRADGTITPACRSLVSSSARAAALRLIAGAATAFRPIREPEHEGGLSDSAPAG